MSMKTWTNLSPRIRIRRGNAAGQRPAYVRIWACLTNGVTPCLAMVMYVSCSPLTNRMFRAFREGQGLS